MLNSTNRVFRDQFLRVFSTGRSALNQKSKLTKKSDKDKPSNDNNSVSAKCTTTKKSAKPDLSSEKKFSNFVKEFNQDSPNHVGGRTTTVKRLKLKHLPKVEPIPHLDWRLLRLDALFAGYRPLLLPVKSSKNFKPIRFDETGRLVFTNEGEDTDASFDFDSNDSNMASNGPADKSSSTVIPNIWNFSAAGEEHFKELDNFFDEFLKTLKPFHSPPPKKTNSKLKRKQSKKDSKEKKD